MLAEEDVSRVEKKIESSQPNSEDGDDGEAYEFQDSDRRDRVLAQITRRRGASKFRNSLLKRFRNRCAVTGCQAVAVLEAAHIDPYRGDDDNNPANGLLLRADIHTLFDLDLFGIEPETLNVCLHPAIAEEYGSKIGHALQCSGNLRPDPGAIQRRFELFEARRKRGA